MDYNKIKGKQKTAWETGDYSMIGTTLQIASEELCEQMDLRAGSKVLDLCTGSGNTAISAARRWCNVIGIDYAPQLLEQARERAHAERLPIEFMEADAENLPFDDESFDVIISTFGVAFAPNQKKAATELLRVCASGGRIALANWVPGDFIAEIFKIVTKFAPAAKGLASPLIWGNLESLTDLLGNECNIISSEVKAINYRYKSSNHFADHHRQFYGPIIKAFELLNEDKKSILYQELVDACSRFNKSGDNNIVAPAKYLAAVFEKN